MAHFRLSTRCRAQDDRGGQPVRPGGHGQDLLQVVGELTASVGARQFGHGGQFLAGQVMAGLAPQGPGQVLQRGHGGQDPAEDDLEDVTGGRVILLFESEPEVVERAEQVLAPLIGIGNQPRMRQFAAAGGKPFLTAVERRLRTMRRCSRYVSER